MRLAGYLMMRGFKLLDTVPNLKRPDKKVFLFIETLELKIAMGEYFKTKKCQDGTYCPV